MADSFFSLPAMETTWQDGANYVEDRNNDVNRNYVEDRNTFMAGKDQYDTPTKTTSVFGDSGIAKEWATNVWDWANTESGSSVIGGAISGAGQVWASEQSNDIYDKKNESSMAIAQLNNDAYMERLEKQIAATKELKMIDERRKDTHNKANNAPINMSVRKYS